MFGYRLGSYIVNLLVPPTNGRNNSTAEIPISSEYNEKDLAIENHIFARQAIINHISIAMSILNEKNPSRTIVIGGECGISVAPFTTFASRYYNTN